MRNVPDCNSPASISAFLSQNGLAMQKKFGQNFLINGGARKKIASSLGARAGDAVWEVGPGLGSMTKELLSLGASVTAFEIDKGFCAALKNFFREEEEAGTFRLVQGDAMKAWKKERQEKGLPRFFFGNLPYNIAAALIADTIENGVRFERCAFTVQKEVARRMAAKEGSADYSSFSVLCQWAYDIKTIVDLGKANFWPRPKVESRAVLFSKKERFPACQNPGLFVKMQRSLFMSRRKTVKNNLDKFAAAVGASASSEEILEKAGVPPEIRAEALPVQKLLLLSDALNSFIM